MIPMTNLKVLRDRFDADNQSDLALLIDCIIEGRLDLAEEAAGIAVITDAVGFMPEEEQELYTKIRNELKQ